VVDTNDGVAVERRDDPRASFAGFEVTTPWDALQVGYFISYACWNYLTAPFLFTYPGVETRELDPWEEDGETWRRGTFSSPSTSTNRRPFTDVGRPVIATPCARGEGVRAARLG
jgi:hypothetical protein